MLVLVGCVVLWPAHARAQITAAARPGATPAWDQGMIPINAESYYHAIDVVGKTKTVSCVIPAEALRQFR